MEGNTDGREREREREREKEGRQEEREENMNRRGKEAFEEVGRWRGLMENEMFRLVAELCFLCSIHWFSFFLIFFFYFDVLVI